ncbi:MAG: hypothetical protein ACRDWS_11465 [Acidimicrobiia bacterium]
MNRSELVDRCKRLIEEAYQDATEMVVAYLERHPDEPRATLCKEIDPDHWDALEGRVRRLQEKRRSEPNSGVMRTTTWETRKERHARETLLDPAKAAQILSDPEVRSAVQSEIAGDDGTARQFFSDPKVVDERKAAVVVDALEDEHVAAQVADRIASDPELLRKVERAQKAERQRVATPGDSIDEAWTRWLNELNTVLLKGARLADRMERENIDPGLIPQVALYAYRLITEKHLDAEIRALLESQEVH